MKQLEYLKLLNLLKRTLDEYLNWGETEIVKKSIDNIILTEGSVKAFFQKKQSKSILNPKEKIGVLKREIDFCKKCSLGNNRLNTVIDTGFLTTGLMFVGEYPDFDKNHKDESFVDKTEQAEQLLTKIIEAMGYTRKNVYITNIIKCRTMIDPVNTKRKPNYKPSTSFEIGTCKYYLDKQIEIIKPKIIILLGEVVFSDFLYNEESIGKVRGVVKEYKGIKLMPTYHPVVLLKNSRLKKIVWDDMKRVMHYLNTGKI
ncbi:MAG: uracil-DNA glycosylase [Endomicrobium sp.]|jgi:DNA polymerase|nr:uracil-DNA glycosylase [Endomicrobium sp.]